MQTKLLLTSCFHTKIIGNAQEYVYCNAIDSCIEGN